ncbi:hypothetical protein D3C85_15520 [compost metagenome]
MNNHGISLIIADSADEIKDIARMLGTGQPSMLKSFESLFFVDPDTVFYCVLRTRAEMDRLVKCFNVRRGVVSHNGHRELVGFNVDWAKRLLVTSKPVSQPMTFDVFSEDRESPFEAIGYR